jgi:Mg2+ and Co2+ transporter CorA
MANTERLNALRKVTLAREEIGEARTNPDLSQPQRSLLNDTYNKLLDTESTLLHDVLQDEIQTLESHADELGKLASRLQRSTESLKKLGDTVKTVSKVIGVLAEIIAKAASVGLL